MPKGQLGETVGGARSHKDMEGGGNPGGPPPPPVLPIPAGQSSKGLESVRAGAEMGQGAQVRRGTSIFPLQEEGSGVCRRRVQGPPRRQASGNRCRRVGWETR